MFHLGNDMILALFFLRLKLGKPQKSYFFLVDSTLRGGGGKGLFTKEKRFFLNVCF